MDSKVRDAITMPLLTHLEPQKEEEEEEEAVELSDENESESESLLGPTNEGILKETPKTTRKVHWKDTYGNNKLAEILVFQPSDVSDSDEDDSEPCLCTIM